MIQKIVYFIIILSSIYVSNLLNNFISISNFILIPLITLIISFAYEWFKQSFHDRKLKNLPDLNDMPNLIAKNQHNLSKWEINFFNDIMRRIDSDRNFLTEKASDRQLNIIVKIYVERVRGLSLKGRSFNHKMFNTETGEEKIIVNSCSWN